MYLLIFDWTTAALKERRIKEKKPRIGSINDARVDQVTNLGLEKALLY